MRNSDVKGFSKALSSVASRVTASRTEKLSTVDQPRAPRQTKNITLRSKSLVPSSQRTFQRHTRGISRWKYDHDKYKQNRAKPWPWTKTNFKNTKAVGFDIEKALFGRGAEQGFAYNMFSEEVNQQARRLGKAMVAKETIYADNDEDQKVEFHETFCRVQWGGLGSGLASSITASSFSSNQSPDP